MNIRHELVRKLTVRALAMAISMFLAFAGVAMILLGIKDTGSIDLKTPFITGQAQSGFVGVLLIVSSVVVMVACISIPKKLSTHRISIDHDGHRLEWEGTMSSIQEVQTITRLLQERFETEQEE